MKFIPIGLQCSVPEGLRKAHVREYSYPLDWLWSPSATSYAILQLLLTDGIDATVKYMTTGWSYYTYLGNEHYIPSNEITESQMNADTGLGITHFIIGDDYKEKLAQRLQRLLTDIHSSEPLILIYADAANNERNYHINDNKYGLAAGNDLLKIYALIKVYNSQITILYFCWNEHIIHNTNVLEGSASITYIPFEYQPHWIDVSNIIKEYILKTYKQGLVIENELNMEPIFD